MVDVSLKKGQVSFVVKVLIIVMVVIAFVLVLGNTGYFFRETKEKKESLDFRSKSLSTMQSLIYDTDCLAYAFDNTSSKGVLNKEKIEDFVGKYKNTEPSCAKLYPHDYSVRIKQLSGEYNVYPEILYRSKIVLAIDRSGSMECCLNPSCDYPPRQKPCCSGGREKFRKVKDAIKILINKLGGRDKIGLVSYGTNARIDSSLTEDHAEVKRLLDKLKSCGGTNIRQAINKGLNMAPQAIILLSDGCYSLSKDPRKAARKAADSKIPIFTIGLGDELKEKCKNWRRNAGKFSFTGEEILKDIAEISGGQYYFAEDPEDLPKIYRGIMDNVTKKLMEKTKTVRVEGKNWTFGTEEFSKGKSLENELTLSAPVSIKSKSNRYTSGRIYLKVVKGELEKLSSMLEKFCSIAKGKNTTSSYSSKVHLSNPVYFRDGRICMEDREGTCKIIDCSLPIEFPSIESEGEYYLKLSYDGDKIKVKT